MSAAVRDALARVPFDVDADRAARLAAALDALVTAHQRGGPVPELRGDFPEAIPLLDYIDRCVAERDALRSGDANPFEVYYLADGGAVARLFYETSPAARTSNELLRVAFEAHVAGRPAVRAVELGAGTGGTTQALAPVIRAHAVDYLFTDRSGYFLPRARRRFADVPTMRYATLDVEARPTETFDVVVAANCLHATRDVAATLANVAAMFGPDGGLLLLWEATRHQRFFELTTALLPGWSAAQDARDAGGPLLSRAAWTAALDAAGFTVLGSYPADDSVLGQSVIAARR